MCSITVAPLMNQFFIFLYYHFLAYFEKLACTLPHYTFLRPLFHNCNTFTHFTTLSLHICYTPCYTFVTLLLHPLLQQCYIFVTSLVAHLLYLCNTHFIHVLHPFLHLCYTFVTPVLHPCYTFVTLLVLHL